METNNLTAELIHNLIREKLDLVAMNKKQAETIKYLNEKISNYERKKCYAK